MFFNVENAQLLDLFDVPLLFILRGWTNILIGERRSGVIGSTNESPKYIVPNCRLICHLIINLAVDDCTSNAHNVENAQLFRPFHHYYLYSVVGQIYL